MTMLPPAIAFAAELERAPPGASAQLTAFTIEEQGKSQSTIMCSIDDVVYAVLRPWEAAELLVTLAKARPEMTEEQRETFDELSEGLIEILDAISHRYRKGMH